MTEEQAERIIELLEDISRKLDDVHGAISSAELEVMKVKDAIEEAAD